MSVISIRSPKMTSNPDRGIFQSARLIYRAIEPSDDAFFEQLNSDRPGYALSSYPNNKLAGPDDATQYRKSCAEKCLLGAVICLAPGTTITTGPGSTSTSADPVPIGEIHLESFGAERAFHRNSEIGLQILPAFQRRGYGSEAIQWALKWAFHHTGLHRVALKAFEYNADAMKCYVRCGFREEGKEREALWFDGRWWDIVCFGLLEQEWRDLQSGKKVGDGTDES